MKARWLFATASLCVAMPELASAQTLCSVLQRALSGDPVIERRVNRRDQGIPNYLRLPGALRTLAGGGDFTIDLAFSYDGSGVIDRFPSTVDAVQACFPNVRPRRTVAEVYNNESVFPMSADREVAVVQWGGKAGAGLNVSVRRRR